jgi:hypothetical protein
VFDTKQSKVCERYGFPYDVQHLSHNYSHPDLDDMRHITLVRDMSSDHGFDVLVGHKNNVSGYLYVCSMFGLSYYFSRGPHSYGVYS